MTDDEVIEYARSRGLTPATMFSRSAVQQVACPACGAPSGSLCQNDRGRLRKTNHLERCFERVRASRSQHRGMSPEGRS